MMAVAKSKTKAKSNGAEAVKAVKTGKVGKAKPAKTTSKAKPVKSAATKAKPVKTTDTKTKVGKSSVKREALRKMVKAALQAGTAPPELLAVVRKKWPELIPAKTAPKKVVDEDDSGLSKKEKKVKAILKKTIKPEKLSRKERRALRLARRKDGPLVRELLRFWEELRNGQCEAARRTELCSAIIDASQGKMRELVMAHDTSRVFESVMKHGNLEQRFTVLEELKNDVPLLMKTKFAKFVVKKMLLHGSREHKNLVLSALEGSVAKMVAHRQAVEVLDSAFNDYANATQRANIVQEVYGPPFSLFKVPGVSKLSEAFAAEPKANRETVLNHVKEILTTAVTKGNARFYIVHYLLGDFLDSCSASDLAEMAQLLKEQLVPLLHTRDGVKVAMRCLWSANNKDRKVILKAMKTFFANTSVDEHGYLFILALLDAVDDIVFLRKTLIKELLEAPETLLTSAHGRKVLLYMLDRRNTCHFHPQLLEILKKGDANPFTKKPGELRSQELRESVLPALLRFAADNLPTLCGSNGGLMVLRQLLTGAGPTDLRTDLVRAVVRLLASPTKVCEGEETFVESPAAHMALKKALQADRDAGGALSSIFLKELSEEAIKAMSKCNRGCFLLVHLCESNSEAAPALRRISALSKLDSSFPGGRILAKKLNGS